MKIVKIKNNILNIGKKLSVIAIISSVTTYILTLFFYAIEHSGVDVSLSYIFTMLFYFCLFASVIILSVILITSIVLTGIVAFKTYNPKEFLNSKFLIILTAILLPIGLILPLH